MCNPEVSIQLRMERSDTLTPRSAVELAEKAMQEGRVQDAERLLTIAHKLLAGELNFPIMIEMRIKKESLLFG